MQSVLISLCLLACWVTAAGAVEEAPRLTDREPTRAATASSTAEAPRLTDREIIERLTRLEEGQKALGRRLETLERHVDRRIDGLDQRIDALRQLLLGGFGMVFAGMFALVGFVIWDRRSALAPAVRGLEEIREREYRLEEVLRTYAQQVPELAEELRRARLL